VITDTKQPFSHIDGSDTNVKPYSFQLSFASSDGSFSFKTSLFTSSYMVSYNFSFFHLIFSNKTTIDNLVATAFVIISIVISFIPWYSYDSDEKVNPNSFLFSSYSRWLLEICKQFMHLLLKSLYGSLYKKAILDFSILYCSLQPA